MYNFRQVLDIMNTGDVFNCVVITYDRTKKKGGKVRRLEGRIIQSGPPKEGRGDTTQEKQAKKKAQNHHQHHTRNICLTIDGHPTEQVRKIRIPLIIQFNGQVVVP